MAEMEPAYVPQQALCSACQQLVIKIAVESGNEYIPKSGTPLLSLGKPSRKIICDLCRYFVNLSPKYKRNYKLHVRLFRSFDVASYDPRSLLATPLADPESFMSVVRENNGIYYDSTVVDELFEAGVIVYLPIKHDDRASRVRLLSSTLHPTDWELLRSWIDHCQLSHVICTAAAERKAGLPYIYLIDCNQERIVRGSPSDRYLALSYVWGQSAKKPDVTQESWPEGSFDFHRAPLTIKDAIRVVRYLQMRFLWVDRYCINQGEGDEKRMMIQNMDQIYENAEATIVAIHGENDEAGLPGVSKILRQSQARFQTPFGCLVSSCPPIATILRDSVWASRGWTYQEARLSRRCLFFTEHQVYSVCREMTRSESVPWESRQSWIALGLNHRRLDARLYGEANVIMNGFFQDRYWFSKRHLTHQSDILDAFRGVLNRSPFITFWGVPITPPNAKMDPHTGLALGLLWCRRRKTFESTHLSDNEESPRTRRAGFPTWSWTSVTGSVFNQVYGMQSMLGKYLAGRADVSIENAADIRFSLQVGGKWVSLDDVIQQFSSKCLPEDCMSPSLLIRGYVVRVVDAGNGMYRLYDFDLYPPYMFAPLDVDEPQETVSDGQGIIFEEAVMLFDWTDSQKVAKKRFMLMLLKWREDGVAERKGLVGDYNTEYDSESMAKIPKSQRTFVLI